MKEYINELTSDISEFSNNLGKMIKKALETKVKLMHYANKGMIKESLKRIVGYVKDDLFFLKTDMEKMGITEEHYKSFMDEVYKLLYKNMDNYCSKTNTRNKDLIIDDAVIDVKDYLNGNLRTTESKKLSIILNPITLLGLDKQLLFFKQYNQTASDIDNEWHDFLTRTYYSGRIENNNEDPLSLEYLISHDLATNSDDFKKDLLNAITESKDKNIIFANFEKWFKQNYNDLIIDFYDYTLNKEKQTPGFVGLITASILDQITEYEVINEKNNYEVKLILSRDKFTKLAFDIGDFFKNDKLRSLFKNKGLEGFYLKQEEIIKTNIELHLSYSNKKNPDQLRLNEFATDITSLFLNSCKKILSKQIQDYEKSNGTQKTTLAKWIVGAWNNIKNKRFKGTKDDSFSFTPTEEIDSFFEVPKLPELPELVIVRMDYGKIVKELNNYFSSMDKEIINKIKDQIGIIRSDDMNQKDMIFKFIKDKWNKYLKEAKNEQ